MVNITKSIETLAEKADTYIESLTVNVIDDQGNRAEDDNGDYITYTVIDISEESTDFFDSLCRI